MANLGKYVRTVEVLSKTEDNSASVENTENVVVKENQTA